VPRHFQWRAKVARGFEGTNVRCPDRYRWLSVSAGKAPVAMRSSTLIGSTTNGLRAK
jgi:hypothetical protein